MFSQFKEFYSIFGVDNGSSRAQKLRASEWVRTKKSRLKKQTAWHDLFGSMKISQIVAEINAVWIDPTYELVMVVEQVKKVKIVEKR